MNISAINHRVIFFNQNNKMSRDSNISNREFTHEISPNQSCLISNFGNNEEYLEGWTGPNQALLEIGICAINVQNRRDSQSKAVVRKE